MKIIRNKQIREAIFRIAANYIIALDTLNKAHDKDAITVEQYADAVQHITANSVECAKLIDGLKGIAMLDGIVKSKMNKSRRNDNGAKDRRDI